MPNPRLLTQGDATYRLRPFPLPDPVPGAFIGIVTRTCIDPERPDDAPHLVRLYAHPHGGWLTEGMGHPMASGDPRRNSVWRRWILPDYGWCWLSDHGPRD